MPESPAHHVASEPWLPLVQQRVFRQLMNAFAYPGRIERLCEASHETADATLWALATLLDGEVSLADPDGLVPREDWDRLEAQRETPERARFIVARGDHPPEFQPRLGTLESPESGATLIVRVNKLGEGGVLLLSGPGIPDPRALPVSGLHPAWIHVRQTWTGGFPLGVDWVLADATGVAALPRTTRIHMGEE